MRGAFQYWGPYLAARGIAVFAISYRLATKTKTFPEAVQDVLAGVQFVRGKAGDFGIDPQRIGLTRRLGRRASRGARGARGKKFAGGYPQDPFAAVDASVKALIGVYGIYDVPGDVDELSAARRPRQQHPEIHGRCRRWKTGSFISTLRRSAMRPFQQRIGVLLVTGTEDDLVDRKVQTDPFQLALKQAGFFVRPCIVQGAPHYWMNDPIDEPGSLTGFVAPRLMRFLAEKL